MARQAAWGIFVGVVGVCAVLTAWGQARDVAAGPSLELTDAEQAWIDANPTVTIALDAHNPPMNFTGEAGDFRGISVDYLRLIAEKAGLKVVFTGHTWDQALKRAMAHEVDGIMTASRKPERLRALNFTDPYFTMPLAVAMQHEADAIHDLADLDGKRVAIVRNTVRIPIIRQHCPGAEVVEVDTVLDGARQLAEGKVDALFDDLPVIENAIDRNLLHRLDVALLYLGSEAGETRVGLRNDAPLLLSIFNKAIAATTDEERQAIRSRWLKTPGEAAVEYALALTDAERDWLRKGQAVRVGLPDGVPPFSFDRGGVPAGIYADYLELLSRRTGLRFEPVLRTWPDLLVQAQTHEVDVFPGIRTAEREAYAGFTRPFIDLSYAIITRQDAPFIRDRSWLVGRRVAVVKNVALLRHLEDEVDTWELQTFTTLEGALRAVSSGACDAYVGDPFSAGYVIADEQIGNLKVAAPAGLPPDQISLAVRNDWPELQGILDKALATISAQQHDELLREWSAIRYDHVVSWREVWQWALLAGGGLLVVLVAAGLWNRSLAVQIRRRRKAEAKLVAYQDHLEALVETRTQKLRESEERYALVLAATRDGMFDFSPVEGTVRYSDRWFEMLGYRREDLEHNYETWRSLLHPDDVATTERTVWEFVDSGKPFSIEFRMRRKDGEYAWINGRGQAVDWSDGKVTRVVGTHTDITAQKRAEQAIRESELRYRTLFDAATDAVVVIENGRFVECNAAAERLFAADRAQIEGSTPWDFSPPTQEGGGGSREHGEALIAEVLETGESRIFAWQHQARDGTLVDTEVGLAQVKLGGRQLVYGVIRDLTERKKAEAAQRRLVSELDHRVKNNLAAVLALARQTAEASESLKDFEETFCGRLYAMAKTHEILASTRWQEFPLRKAAMQVLEPLLGDGERLKLDGPAAVLPAFLASPVSLALNELGTNAAKYGAWSNDVGVVELSWTQVDDEEVVLTWVERGGPAVSGPPESEGMGLGLIRGLITHEARGEVDLRFEPEGLRCQLRLPIQIRSRLKRKDSVPT